MAGAGIQTADDIMSQLMQSVLGGTPLAPFAPMMQNFAYQMMGLQNGNQRDAILDTVLFSNMTPYGTNVELQKRRMNRVAGDALKLQSMQARQGFFTDVGKTLMSYDSWLQQEGNAGGTLEQYNADMQNQALGYMSNPLWSTMYNMLDPDGINAASQNLQTAGVNIIRRSRNQGQRDAFLRARAVGNLFMTGPGGSYNYNKADYGFMDVGETSAVVAALTRDIDPYQDIDARDPDRLKKASDKIRDMAKDYTKALSSLKDVFGKDVPAMIQAVEDLSGQKFTQMSATRVEDIAQRVIAGATVGNYTIGQLSAANKAFAGAIQGMSVPYVNDLGSLAQAETMLAITESGLSPMTMSRQRFQGQMQDFVLRSSNSRGAEALNLAYSLCRQDNTSGTIAQFRERYNELRQTYGTDAAILEISGASSMQDLRRGAGFKEYQQAIEQNLGGEIAMMDENVQDLIDIGRLYIADNGDRAAYDKAMSLALADPSYLTDPDKIDDPENAATRNMSPGERNLVKQMLYRTAAGEFGDQLQSGIIARGNYNKYAPAREMQRKKMDAANRMKKWMISEDWKHTARLALKGEGAWSWEAVKLNNSEISLLDAQDQTLAKQAFERAQAIAGFKRDAREQVDKDFISDYVAYEFNGGLTNELYTDLAMQYDEADKSKKGQLLGALVAAKELDEEDLKRYLGDDKNNLNSQKWGNIMQIISGGNDKYAEMTAAERRTEAADLMHADALKSKIQNMKLSENAAGKRDAILAGIDKAWQKEGYMDSATIKKIFADNGLKGDEFKKDLNTLNDAVNEVYNAPGSQQTQMSDLLTTMNTLLEAVNKLLTEKGQKPE